MHIDNVLYSLTPTEQFGFTPPVTLKMCEWNHSEDNPLMGAVASRIVGFVIIPFSEIVDAFAHLGIASLKGVIGIMVLPYNCLALIFFPERTVRTDFEVSSSLIHLWRVIECLFGAAIFPFICLLNPDAAFRCMGYRLSLHEEEIEGLNQEIRNLNDTSARLRRELRQANQALERTQNNARGQQTHDNERARLLEERANQIGSLQVQLNRVNDELFSKEERITFLQQELERAKANLSKTDQLLLRYTTLHQDVEEDQHRISGLQEKLETANRQKEIFEVELQTKESRIEELLRQIDANNEKITILSSKAMAENPDKTNQKYELKIKELTEANFTLDQNCVNLGKESSRLKKELQLLQGRSLDEKQTLSIQIDQLKVKLDEKQKIENQLRSQLNEASQKNGAENNKQKIELETALKNLQEKSEQNALLQAEFEAKNKQIQQLQTLQKQDEEEKKSLNAAIESLKEQMTNSSSELTQERTQILRLSELIKERTQILDETLNNLQEKSKQDDLLKVEFEAKNNQILQLEILQKQDEEEKQRLNVAIQSLKTELAENTTNHESVVSKLEKKISEMDKKIQYHIKLELEFEKLREKAGQSEFLTVQNKILESYREQNETELARLRTENNELRAGGPNEEGKIIRSPSKGGF